MCGRTTSVPLQPLPDSHGINKKGHIILTWCHRDLNVYKETTSGGCVCLPRRLTWLQAGGTTTTCSYFLETKAAADRPKAQPKAHIYLLRLWEKLGGRSSLTAWQQRSDIGCQASRITCAAPVEHLTPPQAPGSSAPECRITAPTAYYYVEVQCAVAAECAGHTDCGGAQPAQRSFISPTPLRPQAPAQPASVNTQTHCGGPASRFASLKCIIHSTPPSSRAERKLAEPQTLPGSRKAVVQVRIPGACHCQTLLALWQACKEIRMCVAL